MTRCETSHFGAIPYLVSCLPQRMYDNVKTFGVTFKEMGEEIAFERTFDLALEGHRLFVS